MNNFKGWRTIAVNAIVVGGIGSLEFLAGMDWTSVADPSIAIIIVSIVNLGLRLITTSPVGKR